MNETQRAVELFKGGYNCSQSLLGAFCESLGLDQKTALATGVRFWRGDGSHRRYLRGIDRSHHGAGGLRYGSADASDKSAKYEMYRKTRDLVEEFKASNRLIVLSGFAGI